MSIFGSLIGGVMTWRSRSFARTAATDSGSVATASVCLATTAAPMNMGMRQMMFSGGTAPRDRDQHGLLGCEGAHARFRPDARVALPRDADVALDPERLAADLLGQRRERAHGEVEFARLEPGLEVLGVELQHVEPHMGGFLQQAVDQRGQQLEQAGIDHAEIERAVRRSWVERDVLAAQRLHALEDRAHRRL